MKIAILISGALVACGGDKDPARAPAVGSGAGSAVVGAGSAGSGSASTRALATTPYVVPADAPDGLDLVLSDGVQGAPAVDRATLAPATKLSAADTAALLARAKPITADPADRQAVALRPRSQPVQKTGATITGAFPAPPTSLLPPVANGAGAPLQVVRWMPEGKVPLAPQLSVTFSQPMIPVTSQSAAAAIQPVKLSPQVAGNWRWIGTRTILFDPGTRFPQATTYTVELPAGTKGMQATALAQPVKFTFETPPPTVIENFPSGDEPQHVDAPMFLLFDQKIDAAAVLGKLRVTAGGRAQQLVPIDAASLAALAQSKRAIDRALLARIEAAKTNEQDGRWLAFRAAQTLPQDTVVSVEVPAGTPSAEGPNPTRSSQQFRFRTFPPLRVTRSECGYAGRCPPDAGYMFELNNPIDSEAFDPSLITVTPEIPGLRIEASHRYISLTGLGQPRTSYKIVLSNKLRDTFGQTLGSDVVRPWAIGDAQPTFFGPRGMVVLDPSAKRPTLDFFSTNYPQLKVTLYRVAPTDFDAYGKWVQNQWNRQNPVPPPGTKVFDQLVPTVPGKNALVETSVDLSPALRNGLGHVVAVVEPSPWRESYDPPKMISWVQSTKLAVDASVDADNLVAFATELATGAPARDVAVELRPSGTTAKTVDSGLATLALPPASATGATSGATMLVARRGDDTAFVTGSNGYYDEGSTWRARARTVDLAWYVTDDRKLYKPGEQVTLKGWLRTIDRAKHGDVGAPTAGLAQIAYKVRDSRNTEIATGTATLSPAGGFDAAFALPKTPNLGSASVELTAKGKDPWSTPSSSYVHTFQIEEFRTPEFEVTAQAGQGPFLVGDRGDVVVSAKYFSGGPLPGAPVAWNVSASPTTFTPPNRDEFAFGAWTPWWVREGFSEHRVRGHYRVAPPGKPPVSWQLQGKTDATGAHQLRLDFLSAKPAVPMSVATNATVTDVNRQAWTASSALIVHPSSLYVGVRAKKPFVAQGKPFEVDVIGVDLDGRAVPGAAVDVRVVRLDYEYAKGVYQEKQVDPQGCTPAIASAPVACAFDSKRGGTYLLTATIVDARGRPNQTTLRYWVAGGEGPKVREVQQEQVTLIPDKKEYVAGNTAELLVQAPFYPAEGVVSWRRSGIVKTERITLTGPSTVISVPITDAMVPNLIVQVDLVGAAPRIDASGDPDPALPKRPAYAVGQIDLPVPPKQRTLAVTVTPAAAKVAPGDKTQIAVRVVDARGQPVANAETAVIVVDEAILALTGHQFASPIDSFYAQRGADTSDHYLRAYVKLARPDAGALAQDEQKPGDGYGAGNGMVVGGAAPPPPPPAPTSAPAMEESRAEAAKPEAKRMRAQGADKESNAANKSPAGPAIALRTNFNPLAAFAPIVRTDADGRATVAVAMPDNLTRYRVVAIAVAGTRQFGKGESALTARLPLMVRPSPPRFLNFGDTFQLPVVVQNQTDAPMTVRLAARATNAALTDGDGREVVVPANDRVEVRFPAAAELAGTARFQLVGTAGSTSDAAEVALPVWTPVTSEAFATYGVIDDGAIAQPVALPEKVLTQVGGIEVQTASTNLQALTDALLYLVRYPYECAEQRSSRVIAVVALADVLTAFKAADLPAPTAMQASVAADVARLVQLQNGDGGFAFWERGRPSEPYLSVYVANALARAKAKGHAVPPGTLDRARSYLASIEGRYPWYYGVEVRRAISAYALYTRKQIGDVDVAKARRMVSEAGGADKLSLEAAGWLLGTLAGDKAAEAERKAIVRHALNRVAETAGAASFAMSYGDGAHVLLASDRRVDAVMLEALIQEQPDLDLIPKLVTGLLGHRKAGRWLNTQENTFALLALDRYFQTYEKTTPDFVARVWLGADYAGDHAFKGRTTETFAIPIAMTDVATHDKQSVTIQKDGKGRLYYRIGMTYAPASMKLEPADYGFVVQRKYEGADNPGDVVLQPDGAWKIKAGARVRVVLTMINDARRYHVALVDPLPAGLEPMNPALATTGPIPVDPNEQKQRGAYWWWYGPWYEHQNLRDERVEAFAALLWEGVHRYEYVARATTPGVFVVPPTKAEEMYMPETFGRAGSDRVIVE